MLFLDPVEFLRHFPMVFRGFPRGSTVASRETRGSRGTLSTLDISNLGSSEERIAARRARAETKLKLDKEEASWLGR